MRKWFLFLFGFLISLNLFSQQAEAEIDIEYFNSTDSYASGSSVSLHLKTKGIYKLDNEFSLVISDLGGDFNANSQSIASVSEFYTSLLVANLPDNLSQGDYKLRVTATAGFISGNIDGTVASGDYGEIIVETQTFTVLDEEINSEISFINNLSTNEITFQCLDKDVNPSMGSYAVASGGTTFGIPTSSQAVIVNSSVSSIDDLSVTLFDIINGTNQSINVISAGDNQYIFYIPNDLEIGTYNFEVTETFNSSIHSITSFSLIWHSNAPSLDPQSNNQLCVGEEYVFNIDTDYDNGIGRNYLGTYYEIDWGDNTSETYTHAYILFSNQFSHIFNGPSCSQDGGNSYVVEQTLFNRIECLDYEDNTSLSTEVDASEPPVSNITNNDQYCIDSQESLTITNDSSLGQWSGSGDDLNCETSAVYAWEYQKPDLEGNPSGNWQPIFVGLNSFAWIQDVNGDGQEDLVVPPEELSAYPGCWTFRLTATNGNELSCPLSVAAVTTVQVLATPDVDFNIQDLSGNIVEEICPNDTVTLFNQTDILDFACQDLSFEWDINPTNPPEIDNHSSFVQNTNPFSESPIVTFNEPGEYLITLTVTNGDCVPQEFGYSFTVLGTPGVTLNTNGGSEQVCLDSIDEISI